MSSKEVSINKLTKDDRILAVMGPTGVGKSNFINVAAAGQRDKSVGHELRSKTSGVTAVRMAAPNDSVVLVDTPGFDDTYKSDSDILKLIASWLEKTYKKDIKLTGIIYLHRITDNRMSGSPLKNLRLFNNLCGHDAIRRVILASTMWEKLPDQNKGTLREEELKGKYWKDMIARGSTTGRFNNTLESAWDVLKVILDLKETSDDPTLLLQEELVKLAKVLGETAAGRTLYEDLQRQLAKQKETLKELQQAANGQDNKELLEDLEKQCNDAKERVQNMVHQMNEMKIPFSRRILSLLSVN